MNEEIKENIKYIQDIVDFYKLNDENNYDYSDKVLISMKTLLNYITNLQEENQKLKEGIDTLNVQIGTYKYICNDNKKMAENYKKENQKLKKLIITLQKNIIELKCNDEELKLLNNILGDKNE